MYPTQERKDGELIAAVKYGLNDKDVQAKLYSIPMETTAEEIIEYVCKKEIGKREASTVNYLRQKYEKTSQPASSQVLKEVRGAKKGRGHGKSGKGSQLVQQVTNCTKCARSHENGNCYAYGKDCKICGKPNHFAECCLEKEGKDNKSHHHPNPKRSQCSKKTGIRQRKLMKSS